MTTRYEIRLSSNLKHLDIHIQGIPTSAGYEARIPVRDGREHHFREFAEHVVNLLNADVIEQARRANMVEVLNRYAERNGLVGAPPTGRRDEPGPAPTGPGRPGSLTPGVAPMAGLPPLDADEREEVASGQWPVDGKNPLL